MCKLCNLKKKTHWYWEGQHIIICGCLKCGHPIIILREHTSELTEGARAEIKHVFKFLEKQDSRLKNYSVHKSRLKNKEHLYWHIIENKNCK